MKPARQIRLLGHLARAWRSQYWPAARIARWQQARLVTMMRHAVSHVPFYRDLGIAPDSLRSAADLLRFPVLTKRDIQREGRRLLAEGFEEADLHWSRTSGSTGEPTSTAFDEEAWLMSRYVLKLRRLLVRSGVRPGQHVLIVSEARPEQLAALQAQAPRGGVFYQQRFVSIHEAFETQLRAVLEWRPTAIYAFPSWLAELLDTATRLGSELPAVPVVYTSSELLTAGLRARVEAGLRGRICDIYGSTEFKEIAWQCEHERYHVNFESVWIEPLPVEGAGPLVVATLVNRAMPLLRFAIGDEACAASGRCGCGRESPALAGLQGRTADRIELPGGAHLSPYLLTTAIEEDAALVQYRIVETGAGEFRVDLVSRSATRAPDDAALCARLAALTGGAGRFTVRHVDHLPRARSGKRSVFLREREDL